jgi:hypothetical protein
MIELSANTKVNLSTTDRDAMANPLAGMIIYNTTDTRMQFFDGLAWVDFAEGTGVEAGLSYKGVTKTVAGEGIYVLDASDPTDFVLPAATGTGNRYVCSTINTVEAILAAPYIVGGDTAVNGTDIIVPVSTSSSSILNNIHFNGLSNLNDMILVSEYTYTSGSRPKAILETTTGTVIGSWDIMEDNSVNVTGNPSVDGNTDIFVLKVTTYNDSLIVKTNTCNLFSTGSNEPTVEFQLTTTAQAGSKVTIKATASDKFNDKDVTFDVYNDMVVTVVDTFANKYNILQDFNAALDNHVEIKNPHSTDIVDLTHVPSEYGYAGQILAVNINTTGLDWIDPIASLKLKDLTDTPVSYGTPGQVLQMNGGATSTEWVTLPSVGVSSFILLGDTPNTFTGKTGKVLSVNAGETALEYIDKTDVGSKTLVGLTDTPTDYTGSNVGDALVVNAAKNGVDWQPNGASVLTGLLDCPDNFGTPGQVLSVNAATNATVWLTPSASGSPNFVGLTDTPATLGAADQVFRMNSAGNATEWGTPSATSSTLISLTDTPAAYGTTGQALTVNATTDAVEWTNTGDVNTTTTYIKAGLMGFLSDLIPAGVKLILMILEEEIIFEVNAPQSKIKALLAPSSNLVLDIRRLTSGGSDTSIGSINFVAGTNDATVSMSAVTIPISYHTPNKWP